MIYISYHFLARETSERECRRLETDKFALERENKKIRLQIEDLKDQLERKSQQTSAMTNSDVKNLQTDLSSKNKVPYNWIITYIYYIILQEGMYDLSIT